MNKKLQEVLKIKSKKVIGYAIWLLILLLSLSVVRNIGKVGSVRDEIQKEKDKLTKIQNENDELERRIAQVQGEAFIEKEIRNKIGLAKEGEAIVVLPDEDILRKLAPGIESTSDTLPSPNWEKWLHLFF
jgi:cell division protein FtsB